MGETPPAKPGIKRRVAIAAATAFHLALLLCLADGIVDLGYGGLALVREKARPLLARKPGPHEMVNGVVPAQTYAVFGGQATGFNQDIDAPRKAISRPGFTLLPTGERVTPPVRDPKFTVLLLGASQAFGWFNRDDETLAAQLQRQVPGLAVRNFATPGEQVDDNVLVWRHLRETGQHFDAVLIVNAFIPVNLCLSDPAAGGGPALLMVYRAVRGLVRDPAAACRAGQNVRRGAMRALYRYETALAEARSLGVPMAVIVPPLPYTERSNTANLAADGEFAQAKPVMTRLTRALHDALQQKPIPGVYDLGGAFDGAGPYYIDYAGHISAKGQQVLAQAILRSVGPDFFVRRDQKSK